MLLWDKTLVEARSLLSGLEKDRGPGLISDSTSHKHCDVTLAPC